MTAYFLDTSVLGKRYHAELGSDKVDGILAKAGARHYISSLSVAILTLLVLLVAGAAAAAAESDHEPAEPFDVPDGFEVSLYADDDLAHDIFSMTIDARGRVVVAGRDYVKILHDADGDGRAERASLFSPTPNSGAHGMYFDGPDLICTGDDAVRRLSDHDGDGKADDEGQVWARLRHPEHGANGIVRGPDGWYWLIAGNDAGISTEHAALAGSPVKTPRSGGVVRFSPDGKRSDVFAHGFRNPYDLDFDGSGHLFTVDSDGERDHHLPWYAPTRLFDIAQGMEHGWLLQGWQRSWNRPQSFFDNVPRLAELGRGSPTGLLVYRHRQFPKRFRDGLFTCCWTFGRVYFVPLKPDGASLSVDPAAEVFLQTAGDQGFAPVDLAVGPEGDLFVAVGGRGTRGGVFRIRYRSGRPPPQSGDPLDRVLQADQPLASWSRARWVPLARQLGRDRFTAVTADAAYPVEQQIRAVEVLVELFGGLPPDEARRAIALDRPKLTARVAWALERGEPEDGAESILAELTYDEHPAVARAAWEALAALPEFGFEHQGRQPNWLAASRDECRRVRAAMLTAARGAGHPSFQRALGQVAAGEPPRQRMARLWAAMPQADEPNAAGKDYFESCVAAFDQAAGADERLEAVRLVQIGLGDLRVQPGQPEVYSGYSGNATDEVATEIRQRLVERLAPAFPAADAELNRELARLLGMLSADDPRLPEAIVERVSDASLPKDDIHYLIVLSRLPAVRTAEVTHATAAALAGLHPKLAARGMYPDRNWPLRMAELFHELCRRDSELAATLARHEAFGLPDHSLFAAGMSGRTRQAAAGRLLALATESDDAPPWTSQLVSVLGSLPAERVLPHLREQWSDYGLRDAIALVLAEHRQAADRERLVEALSLADGNVVRRAAEALAAFNSPVQPAELATAVRTLREYCAVKEHSAVRRALAGLLRAWSGHEIAIDEQAESNLSEAYQPWFDWFAAEHPDEAARLADFAGADAAAWRERLAAVDFSQGDVVQGKLLFEKRACHRCHVGGGRLGPDLRGAAARFSPQDLFAAIVEPSKEVSPLYQTTLVTTRGGQVYHGLLVYDSADGLLLQTSPDTTVRVTGDDIDQVLPSRQSLMPTGLLNEATDQDLADLYAYLKTM